MSPNLHVTRTSATTTTITTTLPRLDLDTTALDPRIIRTTITTLALVFPTAQTSVQACIDPQRIMISTGKVLDLARSLRTCLLIHAHVPARNRRVETTQPRNDGGWLSVCLDWYWYWFHCKQWLYSAMVFYFYYLYTCKIVSHGLCSNLCIYFWEDPKRTTFWKYSVFSENMYGYKLVPGDKRSPIHRNMRLYTYMRSRRKLTSNL